MTEPQKRFVPKGADEPLPPIVPVTIGQSDIADAVAAWQSAFAGRDEAELLNATVEDE